MKPAEIIVIVALVIALVLSFPAAVRAVKAQAEEVTKRRNAAAPPGWVSSEMILVGGNAVRILTSPDGQRFLLSSNGGIVSYPHTPTEAR